MDRKSSEVTGRLLQSRYMTYRLTKKTAEKLDTILCHGARMQKIFTRKVTSQLSCQFCRYGRRALRGITSAKLTVSWNKIIGNRNSAVGTKGGEYIIIGPRDGGINASA